MFWTENTIPSHLDPDWTEELQLPPITKAQALAGIQPRWDLGENDDHPPIDEIVGLEYFAAHIATWAEFAEDERIFDAYHRPGRQAGERAQDPGAASPWHRLCVAGKGGLGRRGGGCEMPAAKLKRGDGTLDYRVLDRRAMELLLSAQGYTLQQAYQQARDEQQNPVTK